jgi:hypothetical protein
MKKYMKNIALPIAKRFSIGHSRSVQAGSEVHFSPSPLQRKGVEMVESWRPSSESFWGKLLMWGGAAAITLIGLVAIAQPAQAAPNPKTSEEERAEVKEIKQRPGFVTPKEQLQITKIRLSSNRGEG